MHGVVDEKTDVFAYGVLLLELITGRRAVDSDSRQSLVIWVSLHNPLNVMECIRLIGFIKSAYQWVLNWTLEDLVIKNSICLYNGLQNSYVYKLEIIYCYQAKPLLDTNNVKDLADPRLGEEYDPIEMKRAMVTASRCVHHVSSKRPYMNQVRKWAYGLFQLKFDSPHCCTIFHGRKLTCIFVNYRLCSY